MYYDILIFYYQLGSFLTFYTLICIINLIFKGVFMKEKIILTGDRPTGKLHLGHYVGSIKKRLEMQDKEFKKMYVMIADSQALTDNFSNPEKIRDSIKEIILDYLACGINPEKVTIFIQSMIPELTEYTFYFLNLVTLSRLERNPTVKSELAQKDFNNTIPVGFLCYPVSQAADITLFKANLVPVGVDQLPMLEQTNEIVRKFNSLYGKTLVECEGVLPDNENSFRLPGIDGKSKMSKSLGNCIYLSDDSKTVYEKVMKMYTDPNHINISDPGKIEGNVVFTYLEVFAKDEDFKKYLPEFKNLEELKQAYQKGGVGDVKIKKFLYNILEELLTPIRIKRQELENNMDYVYEVLQKGTKEAQEVAKENMKEFKKAMKINYFE